MTNEARALATKKMVAEAEAFSETTANARYASSSVFQGDTEAIANDTTVKFVNK